MKKKENILIILLGLALIILVGIITLTRYQISNSSKQEEEIEKKSLNFEKINLIRPSKLFEKINQKEPIIVIDIRSNEEFEKEHIISSQNLSKEDLIKKDASIIVDEVIYALVDNGKNSDGKQIIKSLGYPQNIFYLSGGFSAWKINSYPTISIGNPESIIDRSKITSFEIQELIEQKAKNEKIVLIDTREKNIYEKEHLKDAINIPFHEIESRYSEIPFGNIFVYAENEIKAFQSGVKLYDLGFFNVKFSKSSFENLKKSSTETSPKQNPE